MLFIWRIFAGASLPATSLASACTSLLVARRRAPTTTDRMDGASHEKWPVRRLTQMSAVSAAHVARSFRGAFGVPPRRCLRPCHGERAVAQLRDTDLPITEIAFQTGWKNPGTFGRLFHNLTGENPGSLRARERSAAHGRRHVPKCIVRAEHRPDFKFAVSEKPREKAVGRMELQSTEVSP